MKKAGPRVLSSGYDSKARHSKNPCKTMVKGMGYGISTELESSQDRKGKTGKNNRDLWTRKPDKVKKPVY